MAKKIAEVSDAETKVSEAEDLERQIVEAEKVLADKREDVKVAKEQVEFLTHKLRGLFADEDRPLLAGEDE